MQKPSKQAVAQVLRRQLDLEVTPGNPRISRSTGRGAELVGYTVRIGPEERVLLAEMTLAPGRKIRELEQHAREVADRHAGEIHLVVAPHVSRKVGDQLKRLGLNYADLRGNIWIREPGFYASIEGNLPLMHVRRHEFGSNPFSKRASLIPRVFLASPTRQWGVREMGDEASVSAGYASEVLRAMARRGYIRQAEGRYRLESAVRLLADWSSVYAWDKNQIYSTVVPSSGEAAEKQIAAHLESGGVKYAFTVLSGSNVVARHVQHDQVYVYIQDSAVDLVFDFLGNQMFAEPVPSGGNLHIAVPYYRDAVFYGSREINGRRVVSDPQLFLDLAKYPVRGEEAAEVLLRRVLGPELGLSRREQDELIAAIEA